MTEGKVVDCPSMDVWRSKLQEAKTSGKLVVVNFTINWLRVNWLMSQALDDLAKKHASVMFLKVDVFKLQDVSAEWEVKFVPTFIFIKDGSQIHKIVGAKKQELESKVKEYSDAKKDEPEQNEGETSKGTGLT